MCVVPQDVHGLGIGDVLKVLPINLHDLKEQRKSTYPSLHCASVEAERNISHKRTSARGGERCESPGASPGPPA